MVMDEHSAMDGHGAALCGANKRQGEGTCAKPAGWGTPTPGTGRCRLHGGNTPTQAAAALRQVAMGEAREAVRKLGFSPVGDPLTALQGVAGELVAVKDWLRGEAERLERIRYEGGSGEQIRGELLAYQAALRDTVNVLTALAKLNIDERLATITEKQAERVIKAVNAALDEAGVGGEVAAGARKAAARVLRAVGAG